MLAVGWVGWKARFGDEEEAGDVGLVDVCCGNAVGGTANVISVER